MPCDALRTAFPKVPKDCFDQKMVAEEKGRKFRIELQKGSDETFCRAQVDDCLIADKTKEKCDWLFFRCKTEQFLFVELKGSDVRKAFNQILATIVQLRQPLKIEKNKTQAFIVSSRVPNGADVQNMKKDFRKLFGERLEVKNDIWIEKIP